MRVTRSGEEVPPGCRAKGDEPSMLSIAAPFNKAAAILGMPVLTADRAWSDVGPAFGVEVRLIR